MTTTIDLKFITSLCDSFVRASKQIPTLLAMQECSAITRALQGETRSVAFMRVVYHPGLLDQFQSFEKYQQVGALQLVCVLAGNKHTHKVLLDQYRLVDTLIEIAQSIDNTLTPSKLLAFVTLARLGSNNGELRSKLFVNTKNFTLNALSASKFMDSQTLQNDFIRFLLRGISADAVCTQGVCFTLQVRFTSQAALSGNIEDLLTATRTIFEFFLNLNIFASAPNVSHLQQAVRESLQASKEDDIKLVAWMLLRAFTVRSRGRESMFTPELIAQILDVVTTPSTADCIKVQALSTLKNFALDLENALALMASQSVVNALLHEIKNGPHEVKRVAFNTLWQIFFHHDKYRAAAFDLLNIAYLQQEELQEKLPSRVEIIKIITNILSTGSPLLQSAALNTIPKICFFNGRCSLFSTIGSISLTQFMIQGIVNAFKHGIPFLQDAALSQIQNIALALDSNTPLTKADEVKALIISTLFSLYEAKVKGLDALRSIASSSSTSDLQYLLDCKAYLFKAFESALFENSNVKNAAFNLLCELLTSTRFANKKSVVLSLLPILLDFTKSYNANIQENILAILKSIVQEDFFDTETLIVFSEIIRNFVNLANAKMKYEALVLLLTTAQQLGQQGVITAPWFFEALYGLGRSGDEDICLKVLDLISSQVGSQPNLLLTSEWLLLAMCEFVKSPFEDIRGVSFGLLLSLISTDERRRAFYVNTALRKCLIEMYLKHGIEETFVIFVELAKSDEVRSLMLSDSQFNDSLWISAGQGLFNAVQLVSMLYNVPTLVFLAKKNPQTLHRIVNSMKIYEQIKGHGVQQSVRQWSGLPASDVAEAAAVVAISRLDRHSFRTLSQGFEQQDLLDKIILMEAVRQLDIAILTTVSQPPFSEDPAFLTFSSKSLDEVRIDAVVNLVRLAPTVQYAKDFFARLIAHENLSDVALLAKLVEVFKKQDYALPPQIRALNDLSHWLSIPDAIRWHPTNQLFVTIAGAPETGKTSLVRTLENDLKPVDPPERTIGVDFSVMGYGKNWAARKDKEITFFDLAGQHEYGGLHAIFGTSRNVLLLVVDLSSYPLDHSEYYERVQYFLDKALASASSTIRVLLVGTKVDEIDVGEDENENDKPLRIWMKVYARMLEEELQQKEILETLVNKAKDAFERDALLRLLNARPEFLNGPQAQAGLPPLLVSNTDMVGIDNNDDDEYDVEAIGVRKVQNSLLKLSQIRTPSVYIKVLERLQNKLNESFQQLRSLSLNEALAECHLLGFKGASAQVALNELHEMGHILWFKDDPSLRNYVIDRDSLVALAKELVRHDLKSNSEGSKGKLFEYLCNSRQLNEEEISQRVQRLESGGLVYFQDVIYTFPAWREIGNESHARRIVSLLERFHIVTSVGENKSTLFIPSQVSTPLQTLTFALEEDSPNSNPLSTAREVFSLVGIVPPFLMEKLACAVTKLDPRLDSFDKFPWKFSSRRIVGRNLVFKDIVVELISLALCRVDSTTHHLRVFVKDDSRLAAGLGLQAITSAVYDVLCRIPSVSLTLFAADPSSSNFIPLVQRVKLDAAFAKGEVEIPSLGGTLMIQVADLHLPLTPWDANIDFCLRCGAYSASTNGISSMNQLSFLFSHPLVFPDGEPVNVNASGALYEQGMDRIEHLICRNRQDISFSRVLGCVESLQNSLVNCTVSSKAVMVMAQCSQDALILQTQSGVLHGLSIQDLYVTLKVTFVNVSPPRLVILNTSHSAEVGKCFASIGVPHVVAFSSEHELHERAALTFSNLFFERLANGASVREAFGAGVEAVRGFKDVESEEADYFKLIPERGNHDEVVWEVLPVVCSQ